MNVTKVSNTRMTWSHLENRLMMATKHTKMKHMKKRNKDIQQTNENPITTLQIKSKDNLSEKTATSTTSTTPTKKTSHWGHSPAFH